MADIAFLALTVITIGSAIAALEMRSLIYGSIALMGSLGGIAGLKGRHMLFHDKCTGCQLCSIACEGVAEAIAMVKVPEEHKQNKKSIMPQIDYGKCVFCGLCVDACPFYALYMTNDYELSSFSKEGLIYTPAQLQVKPYVSQDSEIIITARGASHG